MDKGEITVNIRCSLNVSKRDAEAALRIVEIYANAHDEIDVVGHRQPDGTLQFEFVERDVRNG